MKLQHTTNPHQDSGLFPVGVIKTAEEILAAESQTQQEPAELEQRKEFVERIEAFCDCV